MKTNACGDVETVMVKGGILLLNAVSDEQLAALQVCFFFDMD